MAKEAKCPYCQKDLDKMPTRKKQCPNCKNFIYVRQGQLFTEEELKKIDEEIRVSYKLQQFNILKKDYEIEKENLRGRFGTEPSSHDVIWSIANKQILQLKDFEALSHQYEKMAYLLNEEKREFSHILKQAKKFELKAIQKEGFKKVQISPSYYSCPSCLEQKDKILTIDEALETMPLPNKDCTHVLQDPDRGYCQCKYTLYYENDDEDRIEFKIESPKIEKQKTKKNDQTKIGCLILIIIVALYFLITSIF